jgi:phospholipid/cholesterol/gamma-HCH transport system ATP-binding protein
MFNGATESASSEDIIRVQDLTLGYGERIVLEHMDFSIHAGEIVSILGGSGCGKSTLLKALIGLLRPLDGRIFLAGREITGTDGEAALADVRRRIGVLFQSGALIGSLSLGDNIALPLHEFSRLPQPVIRELVRLKLELVGLGGFEEYLPAELSGGMRKRAALARAMALDPDILFCDEPSAGLDPITSAGLDELLMELNRSLGITMVVITHELPSIERISQRSFMLDGEARGIIAMGPPAELKSESADPRVQAFFHRQTRHPGKP